MANNPAAAYRDSRITTADPVALVAMLFDGALKAIKLARLHHEQGNREKYAGEVERATLIIGELLAALDTEQGELPRTLSGIYSYSMARLVEAMMGDVTRLDEVEQNIGMIAEAWKAAATTVAADTAGEGAA